MKYLFKDDNWSIISYGSDYIGFPYYSRHDCMKPGDRAWMCFWQRNCSDCDERVPDSIQTILRLLASNSSYGEDKI